MRGLAPSYLSEFCRLVPTLPGRRQLRSGTTGILHVHRTKTFVSSRSFGVAGPVTYMEQFSLPAELRTLELSVPSFSKRLKTVINCSLQRIVVAWFLICAVYKYRIIIIIIIIIILLLLVLLLFLRSGNMTGLMLKFG